MPVHVHPEDDICQHDLSSRCVCGPSVDCLYEPNGPVYIHHSLDGREAEDGLFGEKAALGTCRRWITTETVE